MEYVLIVLAILFALIGLAGAVLPVLPGAPISYGGLLLVWLLDESKVSETSLWVMGVLMVVVTVIDYVAPIWLTKIGGGSKKGTVGATIGLVFGLFFMPWGLILGPFLGALVGELSTSSSFGHALKVASLSFVAFILTTGFKVIYGLAALVMVVWALWFS